MAADRIIRWCESSPCCDPLWEKAYQDFETPEEEIAKFLRRYRRLGLDRHPRDQRIVELFCGRGNGLVALGRLGFQNLEGVDLSQDLLLRYEGPAQLYLGNCRELHFEDRSKDVLIVQGGLHHLNQLPDDVEDVLREVQRVLRTDGCFMVVEPWRTPFLDLVDLACEKAFLRAAWKKLDALARMSERERTTYRNWLARPAEVLSLFEQYFHLEMKRIAWGKLMLRGRPRR